jgi:ribbon-helix-helix CopG family protein
VYIYTTVEVIMRRTQLYLSDELTAKLHSLSQKEHKTISQLVRTALEEKYLTGRRLPVKDALKAVRGIWEDRKDFDAEIFIRSLRDDTRSARLNQKRR